jgi:hypothetical protein
VTGSFSPDPLSHPDLPPPPPPPPPPAGATRRRSAGRWALGCVAFGTAALVGWRLLAGSGPDHPDEWDPRVEDLAEFVEDQREREFDHPVYVDFLTDEEYADLARSEEDDLSDADRESFEQAEAMYRAMGLAEGDLDLFAAFNDVVDAGTLAFYDSEEDRVRVRGTELTPGLRVTLVHELTHALQDQLFDLERVDEGSSGEQTAFRALVEGDAINVEQAFTSDGLSPEDLRDYEDELAEQIDEAEQGTADVPGVLAATFGAPYDLGGPLVLGLRNDGGNARLDEAFDDPPTTEEHIFDPLTYLDTERDEGGEAEDVEVEAEDALDQDTLGSVLWYLMLVERIDPDRALEATDGWDGGTYALVDDEGTTCLEAAFAGDTDADEEEMAEAIDAWMRAMPSGDPEAVEVDGRPGLRVCDPGAEADLGLTGRSERALAVPSLRSYLIGDALTTLEPDEASCFADEVMDNLTFAEITDPAGKAFEEASFRQTTAAALESCQDT